MKRLTPLVMAILAIGAPAMATIHTVSNMPFSPGQHTTFASAHSVATTSDTIYVHGSSFNYGDIVIFKEIVVIGSGHNPNKQLPMTAAFGIIDVNAFNVELIGLTFYALNASGGNGKIKKCKILGLPGRTSMEIAGHAWLIEGCIFDYETTYTCINFNTYSSHVVQHNIFATYGVKIYGAFGSPGATTHILNNVFLGDGNSSYYSLEALVYPVIRNNIFLGSSPYLPNGGSVANQIVERNISFQCYVDEFWPNATYGLTNLPGVDPQFLAFSGGSNLFDYGYDFNVVSTSPGNNYGTDGTDVGVFGGLGELFTITGEPSIAEITVFDITSPTTISPGGTLTISVTSKRVK